MVARVWLLYVPQFAAIVVALVLSTVLLRRILAAPAAVMAVGVDSQQPLHWTRAVLQTTMGVMAMYMAYIVYW